MTMIIMDFLSGIFAGLVLGHTSFHAYYGFKDKENILVAGSYASVAFLAGVYVFIHLFFLEETRMIGIAILALLILFFMSSPSARKETRNLWPDD